MPLQLPTANFYCNCGIALPHRSRLRSICSNLHKLICPNWLMKYSRVHTIGTVFHLHHWGARPSFTKIPRNTNVMGKTRYQRMVRWTVYGPLLLQSLFFAGDTSIPNFWVRQMFPPTLPSDFLNVEQAFTIGDWRVSDTVMRIAAWQRGARPYKSLQVYQRPAQQP